MNIVFDDCFEHLDSESDCIESNAEYMVPGGNHIDDVTVDLCPFGCGQVLKRGILAQISHTCNVNHYVYTGGLGIKMFENAIRDLFLKNPMACFEGLLIFKSMNAMPGYEDAAEWEKEAYRQLRRADIRIIKRLKKHIKKEEEFVDA